MDKSQLSSKAGSKEGRGGDSADGSPPYRKEQLLASSKQIPSRPLMKHLMLDRAKLVQTPNMMARYRKNKDSLQFTRKKRGSGMMAPWNPGKFRKKYNGTQVNTDSRSQTSFPSTQVQVGAPVSSQQGPTENRGREETTVLGKFTSTASRPEALSQSEPSQS